MKLFRSIWTKVRNLLVRNDRPSENLTALKICYELTEREIGVEFLEGAKIENCGQKGSIQIGEYSHIAGHVSTLVPNAAIKIGKFCFIGLGSRIWSQSAITIGNNVLISHLVDIHDTDSHSLNALQRRQETAARFQKRRPKDWSDVASKPITIEDDVWIGYKASIMKGVRIGSGAVVGAGSVVTKDVPMNAFVAGNPAVVIRLLNNGLDLS